MADRDAGIPSSHSPISSVVIFSPELAQLVNDEYRLAPTYVGTRRIRPSTRDVKQAMKAPAKNLPEYPHMTFKVVDKVTGKERRMTSSEKKEAKLRRREQWKMQRDKMRQVEDKDRTSKSPEPIHIDLKPVTFDDPDDRYVKFDVEKKAIEQELADLRGVRNGVPPVAIPSSLAFLGSQMGLWGEQGSKLKALIDDELSQRWALALKESMRPAETARIAEDMRDMPYHIVPEVWSRMRPVIRDEKATVRKTPVVPLKGAAPIPIHMNSRSSMEQNAVAQVLLSGSNINMSCGASFGCDLLLYDGNRCQRHAFAGLRVLYQPNDMEFPLPTAYNMAGYVRGLNSAGKLALLAFAVPDEPDGESFRVAIVDLALVKLTTRGNQRTRESTLKRRFENLAK